MRRLTLLISAHDFGSGINLWPVYKEAILHADLDVYCLISGASQLIFEPNEKIIFSDKMCSKKNDVQSLNTLLKSASEYINMINPDMILTGISSQYASLDEALIKMAKSRLKTYSFQDYWGYINNNLGVLADTVFVIDKLAAELTSEKSSSLVEIVGTPKSDYYDNDKMREIEEDRKKFKMDYDVDQSILFIGQPFWHLEGYKNTLKAISTLAKYYSRKLIYLPHPAENITNENPKWIDLKSWKIFLDRSYCLESILLEHSKVMSCFSSCIFDAMLLKNKMSLNKPILGVIFLDAEMIEQHALYAGGLKKYPVTQDQIYLMHTENDLSYFFEISNSNLNKNSIHAYTAGACKKILQYMKLSHA